MELLQLKYFVHLANNEHLTRTANEMYVTPSAISTSISRLEDELGVKLFDRIGRGMKLNQYGKIYKHYIDQVIILLDQATHSVESEKNRARINISIAVRVPILWQKVFSSFRNIHKDYVIKQHTIDMELHKHELEKFDIDLFVATSGSINNPEWDSQILFDDEIVLGMSVNHRLATQDEINLSDLRDELFVGHQATLSLKSYCDDMCKMAGFTPRYSFDCDESIRTQIIASSNDFTFTTLYSSMLLGSPNYTYKKIRNIPTMLPFSLFWKKTPHMRQGVKIFRDFLLSYDYEKLTKHI